MGREKFRTITRTFFRGANGLILVYDPADKESIDYIWDNYRHVEESIPVDCYKMVVANRVCRDDDCDSLEDAKQSVLF